MKLSTSTSHQETDGWLSREGSLLPGVTKGLRNLSVSNMRKSISHLASKLGASSKTPTSAAFESAARISAESSSSPPSSEGKPLAPQDRGNASVASTQVASKTMMSFEKRLPEEDAGQGGHSEFKAITTPTQESPPLPRTPLRETERPSAEKSPVRATSSTQSVDSVISLDFESHTPRSASVDADTAPARSLKWGAFLEKILAKSSDSELRPEPPVTASWERASKQQNSWETLITRDTALDAGARAHLSIPDTSKVHCAFSLQSRWCCAQFFIQAVTVDGRFAPHGGARFVVYVHPVEDPHRGEEGSLLPELDPRRRGGRDSTGENSLEKPSVAQVLDNEDGSCTVFFSCSVAVRHQVTILLDDKYPVASSPYIVSVVPGRIDPSQTVAHGESLKFFGRNGEMNDFVIQARDAHGNNIKCGGDALCVEGLGAINVVETLDFNDGLYRVKFFVRAGCESQYCQLNIRCYGQHIQGSPFYPKPFPEATPRPSPKPKPKAFTMMDLMNPSKSLIGAMNKFSSRMEETISPKLPTVPPFPSTAETHDLLRKLMDRLAPANVDLTPHHLAEMRRQLKLCLRDLADREEDLENMLDCIKRHVSAGLLHAKIEDFGKADFDRLTKSVAQIQKQLHTTYKSLQHRVADSLPVTFELEDPVEIKRAHKERRAKLIQVHSQLQAKERELRVREKKIKEQISSYMSELALDLKSREHALEMEQRALNTNTRQVLKLTSNRLKKHARREALTACEREPVEAHKSSLWQRDFHRMLLEAPIVMASSKATAPKSTGAATHAAPPEPTRQVETRPVDPNSFAFWLAEKQYAVAHKGILGGVVGRALDDRTAYRQTNLRRGNPSRVTFTEWRAGSNQG
ncbi:filamin abp280 repeat-containing protein [Cyclospora cayetanensis]|uniref:Filamin abp280 repeat-containing protein n=1 Tax=Cyclospora cayetanensis TaxID=88456 RepID=A0A1D3D8Q0_9EIME|nr:filamin abp280 repeat-containing protein [Cyclospora cayetanensis]